jgi:cell wall-associated NlpC family hydrolase
MQTNRWFLRAVGRILMGGWLFTTLASCQQPEAADQAATHLPGDASTIAKRDSVRTKGERIAQYAATLLNTPYKVAGKDEEGFDCSGFVSYVFAENGLSLPSSTRALIGVGQEIPLAEAIPGDLIFFTGTDPASTEVGHVGIVVSPAADSIQFIHSSSARSSAYVKYNVLEASPGYQKRFLMVRRVLEANELSSSAD